MSDNDELEKAVKILRRVLRAFRRGQWQGGPTDDEVIDEITDFLANLKTRRMVAGYPKRKAGK